MSLLAVARKDFKSAYRSRALWTTATAFAVLTALIAYGSQGFQMSSAEQVKNVFANLGSVLGILLPIVALVASYMSVAGERESGGIKFLLGFPNTRQDVFLGKLASRLAVVWAGLAFMFLSASMIAVARHGAFPLGVILGVFLLSVVYGSVFVSVAVAFSSAVSARSRAIGAAVGSYFVLIVLYIMPGVRIPSLVRFAHSTMLGADPNPDLYNAVAYSSPFMAFQKSLNLVLPEDLQRQVFRRAEDSAGDLPVYLTDEFSLVVFAAWLVVPLVLGYLRFEGSDLE